jgi:lipopolysaccharide export system protein LptC
MPRWLIITVLLLVAAVATWQLGGESSDEDAGMDAPSEERAVDYRVRGFEVVRMTADGAPAHRLRAASLRHFIDDGTSELETPHLTVFQDDAPPWEVDAAQAWMSADGSLILLTGTVVIEREGDAANPPTRLTTSELRVQPRTDYAETDAPVRLETDLDRVDAVGMQAWLRPPSRLKLLSEVEGVYVPR